MHVHIIKMGGTIEFFDPEYDMIKNLMKLDSTIDYYFRNIIKPHFEWSTTTLTQKDSREITDEERGQLAQLISESKYDNFVVTHGTFTMGQTAQFLNKRSFPGKKIIFTGSMIPLAGFTTSDAGFNLGFAVASFSHVKQGIYLSMNGGIFSADEVEKNLDLFRFE